MLRKTLVVAAIAALTIMTSSPALATTGDTQPGNDGVHKVWVCKYSGTPYVDEVLKPGKNPIAVDGSATVGTYFKDGQGQSYVLDDVTDENTAQGESYKGTLTCPEGRSFDYDWEYAAPTCTALTVDYPAALPAGQANDVNVRLKNLATGAEKTLNFHNGGGTWSGTQVFDFTSHHAWPGWGYYAVTWVQVAGSNYHWSGQVTCGEREKPVKPETKVERTEWEVSDYLCESETVTLTRSVTTTTYSWDEGSWSWKASESTETETDSRAMTEQEKAAQCEEPPVDVCQNLPGVQTEVPAGYEADGHGNCCKCTPPPVVDKCLNIDGDQATVPEGMTRDGDGDCWTPKPETKVEYTEWSVSDYMCTSEKVTETRTKSTTTYTWDTATGAWVGATTETTETEKRAMTEDEAAELCPPDEPHKVFVCKYVKGPDGYEVAQTGQNPISVDTHAIPGWDDSLPIEDNPKWFADAQGPSMVIGWDEEQGDGQNNEPTIDDCLMPPVVQVSDWSGEPMCGMDSYTEWATETTTGYLLVADGAGYSWEPYTTYKTLYRTAKVEEVVPCEDATAEITVIPASCDAPGAVDEVTTMYATLEGSLDETVGDHLATFTADEGHAFAGGDTELVVSYSIAAQLTEGCATDSPTPPSIDGTIVGEICTADAPYLGYDITLTDPDGVSTDDGTATITFVHPTNAAKNWTTTVEIGTGKVLWPGASVDKNGVANNWPGYKYDAAKDEWVSVGNKNYGWTRAEDTEVIISVNPSKSFEVSYPPATPVCNSEPAVEILSVLDAPAATPVTGVATYTG
ncbi:hypothetical protein [Demequina maris]|uniref:hypothetical protein n=1 Tax=Demequina maris TaxID=1638982 RepID=UPI000784ED30|nr:hypothetical protein [Demequina maris]